ncbi:hypothetical protein [Clostridium sp. BNL1100]|uniref:hypothetical protein n=1 Tax=Clostridium sp. BNL1100 TaxID=755731 RepID=UPI0002E12DF4|nr:hypothetical protein [Clostridium sp. BNL1100]
MYKNIYFYKLDIKKLFQLDYFPESTFYKIFDERFNMNDIKANKDPDWGPYSSCSICNDHFVDILEHNKTCLFGTIGRTRNEKRQRRIRDITNLAHSELSLAPNTILEDYTYFYMDYFTGIISVMSAKGAPDIKILKNIINHDAELDPEIYAIKNRDVNRSLDKIEEVAAVELSFAVPPEELLGDNKLCTSFEIINQFKKDGFERCQLKLYMDSKNPKRKNPHDIINHTKETYKLVNGSFENEYKLEKLELLAKPTDDHQQCINVLELYFTKGMNIKIDENFTEEIIKIALYEAYNTIKAELLENIVLHVKVGV